MIFKTKNSAYEFSADETKFRRLEGRNPTLLPVSDGEWHPYREASLWGNRLYIEWGDEWNEKITTSAGEFVDSSD
jgi:hypothetical protein